jgi:hypothetical protein
MWNLKFGDVNMEDKKKLARITGVLYLVVIVCAGFSQGVVRESIFVNGDAYETARNIMNAQSLFTWGLVTDLIAFSTDIAISILFYYLFKDVNQIVAVISSAFRLIAHPAIASLNLINHYNAMAVLKSPGMSTTVPPEILNELSLNYLEAHHIGYLIAGVAFGIHCALLGYLLFKSLDFPKLLGILLILAAGGYLIESFGFLFFPEAKVLLASIVGVTAGIGEVGLCLYLLIKGVRQTSSGG